MACLFQVLPWGDTSLEKMTFHLMPKPKVILKRHSITLSSAAYLIKECEQEVSRFHLVTYPSLVKMSWQHFTDVSHSGGTSCFSVQMKSK